MKNVILVVVCSFLFFFASSVLADDEYSRGEIRLGWGYSQNNVDVEVKNSEESGYSLELKRMGVDSSIGISFAEGFKAMVYELYFHADFYNFNEAGEQDNTWFIFGARLGVGPNIPVSSRHVETYFLPCWSLMSMGVDTELGPAWTPQIGLNIKVGIFYVRVIFYGIVAKDEKGYGFMIGTGGVYASENLDDL